MEYLYAFVIGGLFCVIGQILIDKTKLTPARILTGYVVAGVFLGAIGVYQYLADFQKITGKEKEKCIKKIHEKGVSIRQIVRLCGEPKSMVEKWVKC